MPGLERTAGTQTKSSRQLLSLMPSQVQPLQAFTGNVALERKEGLPLNWAWRRHFWCSKYCTNPTGSCDSSLGVLYNKKSCQKCWSHSMCFPSCVPLRWLKLEFPGPQATPGLNVSQQPREVARAHGAPRVQLGRGCTAQAFTDPGCRVIKHLAQHLTKWAH